jgi:tripartite-type tricarboxylate transporter receptor subunit TctC
MKILRLFAAAGLVIASSVPALAQQWPTKPVKVIVPWAPGGAVDVATRKVAQKLADQLGQPFVVENKPGASSTIGAQLVVNAPADGYTLVANDMSYSLLPYVFKKLPFDHEKDLVPVSTTMIAPYAIAVKADGPYKTLQDLIKAAKASPGKLTYGTGGPGSAPHFATESLSMAAKMDLLHVPYKGAADAMTALIGGQIDLVMASVPSLVSQAKGGKARILAVSGDSRLPVLPDVPTFAEAGLKDFGILNFNGLWAPKGTPPQVIAKLQSEIAKAVAAPDVKAFFETQGGYPAAPRATTSASWCRPRPGTGLRWPPRANIEKQ